MYPQHGHAVEISREAGKGDLVSGEAELCTNKHRPVSVEKGTSADKDYLHSHRGKVKNVSHTLTPTPNLTTGFPKMRPRDEHR